MKGEHFVLLSTFLAGLAGVIVSLDHWGDATKPVFVASVLVQIASMLRGFYSKPPNGNGPLTRFMEKMPVVLLALVLTAGAGCASLTTKQRATSVHQALHQALVLADDTERTICQPVVGAEHTCSAVPRLIADVQHQAISRALVAAFEKDAALAVAMRAWEPGKPPPANLPALRADLEAAWTAVAGLVSGPRVDDLRAHLRAALDAIEDLIARFGGPR